MLRSVDGDVFLRASVKSSVESSVVRQESSKD